MDLDVQKTNKKMFFRRLLILVLLLIGSFSSLQISYSLPVAAKIEATVSLVNAKKSNDLSNIALWLEPSGSTARIPKQSTPYPAMRQKGKKFVPKVLIVSSGYYVSFPNDDPFPHNVFSPSEVKKFDLGLYQAGENVDQLMNRPGVIPVYCNIHPQMKAFVISVKTAYYALSDDSGKVEINNVPNGKYTLKVWHERATTESLNKLSREVTVSGSTVNLGSIQVDEAGFSPFQHKNKDGKDYAPK
ncbi:MAG: hypothetical protein HY819_06940 [Acidobacteria bacterium]|nr:hypothetical protein [Acidobacteriota bacterium]